jgi:SAM-dependent methyltransferase
MSTNLKEPRKVTAIEPIKEVPPLPMFGEQGSQDRQFDRTFFGTQHHGRLLHRNYAAHFFRWSFARRHIAVGSKVIDVGCGPELPLFHVLSLSPSYIPASYLGVDLNRLTNKPVRAWARVIDKFDFTSRWAELPKERDTVVCYEVIEHMQPDLGTKLLQGCHAILKEGGTLLLSTPVFNGKQTRTHLHEYEIDELKVAIEAAGFTVERRFGTFMSAKEIKNTETKHEGFYEELREYYDNDATACIFAPLYPDLARNNLWVCRK